MKGEQKMKILFLGDSITDCDHCFSEDNLGFGYVKYAASLLQRSRPDAAAPKQFPEGQKQPAAKAVYRAPDQTGFSDLTVINGGTDGFTFPLILQKWQRYYAEAAYDAVVVAGGINDVGVMMSVKETEAEIFFERSMDALRLLLSSLLCRTGKLLVVEPFLFPHPAFLALWQPRLEGLRCHLRQICESFDPNTVHVLSVQDELDALAAQNGYPFVTTDGIHLTEAGHRLLGQLTAGALHRILREP